MSGRPMPHGTCSSVRPAGESIGPLLSLGAVHGNDGILGGAPGMRPHPQVFLCFVKGADLNCGGWKGRRSNNGLRLGGQV